jgi:diacylglycerol kinase family enzyme
MNGEPIDVIATTTSGSIQDWGKVERVVPLFREAGLGAVQLHVVDTHREAREKAAEVVGGGGRVPISAGGSGTFRAVLEGCVDSGVSLREIRLGFLRKGSADLIGKVLGMSDEIEKAVAVFAESIQADSTVPCDVLLAESAGGGARPLHFVGYGGTEIFGRIPHFTENRFMKWYKGVLSQFFGDLGPFTTGMGLAVGERMLKERVGGSSRWTIRVDGRDAARGRYQALILVNGYLGPDLPFTRDSLGSGHFHLFALRDLGLARLPRQALAARSGAITEDPERWGLESFLARESLELIPDRSGTFPANVDGSTLRCRKAFRVRRVDRIRLIAKNGEPRLRHS